MSTALSSRITAWAPVAALAALAGFAHRDLLTLSPRTALGVPLSSEVQGWFFEPSDTSPALVLLFIGWLLYRRGARLGRTLGRGGAPALTAGLFAAGIGVFFWALRTGAADLQAITLFFEGLAVANAFGGLAALRIVIVPVVFLVFALPMPAPALNELVWKFQIWTADYSGFLLHLLGQPALVSGDQILRADQVFQIIETCSGLRTAETLTMLAVLMADLFRRRGWHALILIVAALPVSFIINGFRALTLMFNPHSDIVAVHNLQGIVMLLGGVLGLYALDGGLERVLPQRPPPQAALVPAASGSLRAAWIATALATALLALLSVGVGRWQLPPLIPDPPTVYLGQELGDWKGADRPPDRMFLGLASFSSILNRDYESGRQRVNVFVGVAGIGLRYRSFYSPKTIVPATGFIVEQSRRERRGDRWVDVRLVRRGATRLLVHHWRESSEGLLRETLRAALALDQSPLRRGSFPVVVRLLTPVSTGPASLDAGERRLDRLADLIAPLVGKIGSPRGTPAS